MKLARRFFSSSAATKPERVFVALGSNVGHRSDMIHQALRSMRSYARIIATSFLYQSKPMYLEAQPNFFNAVVEIQTDLEPHHLLKHLKDIEQTLGRGNGHSQGSSKRNGPRCIDLDILLYGQRVIQDTHNGNGNNSSYRLTVPHEGISERAFVLRPLCDIDAALEIPRTGCDVRQLLSRLYDTNSDDICRVTPVREDTAFTWDINGAPLLMGIINATPDSFSDGGRNNSTDAALRSTGELVAAGFDIVDVGGYSTRPGAAEVRVDEELGRVLPVIQSIRKEFPGLVVSCDTFRGCVAREAVAAGADIINDVGAGQWDDDMKGVLAEIDHPWIAMHSRGRPDTMNSLAHYGPDVVDEVAGELKESIDEVEAAGVPKWRIIADGGIGFAKNAEHNLQLLGGWKGFREKCGNYPTLVGLSRKRFLSIPGDEKEARDWATAGATAATIAGGGTDIVRVHRAEVAHAVRAAHRIAVRRQTSS